MPAASLSSRAAEAPLTMQESDCASGCRKFSSGTAVKWDFFRDELRPRVPTASATAQSANRLESNDDAGLHPRHSLRGILRITERHSTSLRARSIPPTDRG